MEPMTTSACSLLHNLQQSLDLTGMQVQVRIQESHQVASDMAETVLHGVSLPAIVGIANSNHVRELRGSTLGLLKGIIPAAVVHHDDLMI